MDQENLNNPSKTPYSPGPQIPRPPMAPPVPSGFYGTSFGKRPVQTPNLEPQDPSFLIMPQSAVEFRDQENSSGTPPSHHVVDQEGLPIEPEKGDFRKKIVFIILAVVGILVIGGAVYYFFIAKNSKPASTSIATTKLPKVWLQQYFAQYLDNSGNCNDQTICVDNADPDHDGLTNYDEFKERTIPINPDSDGDGLADGDEVNIYKTNPNNKFTDTRDVAQPSGYTDGVEIKNSYDPLTPGQKMTDARKQQIADDTAKYSLHEPTIATLKSVFLTNETNSEKTYNVSIETGKFVPPTVAIGLNDTVVWINNDSKNHHIVSDPHPNHTDLPGFESAVLKQNDSYSFKFSKTGNWGYHDELDLNIKGVVEVK